MSIDPSAPDAEREEEVRKDQGGLADVISSAVDGLSFFGSRSKAPAVPGGHPDAGVESLGSAAEAAASGAEVSASAAEAAGEAAESAGGVLDAITGLLDGL